MKPANVSLSIICGALLVSVCGWFLAAQPAKILAISADSIGQELFALITTANLKSNLGFSLWRLLVGSVAGIAAGLIVGLFIGLLPSARTYLGFIVNPALRIPVIALAPLLFFLLADGTAYYIVVVFITLFFSLIHVIKESIYKVPINFIELAQVYQLKPKIYFRLIIWPAILPAVLTNIRVGITSAWVLLLAVELAFADVGVGAIARAAATTGDANTVILCVAVISLIATALHYIFFYIERNILRKRGSVK